MQDFIMLPFSIRSQIALKSGLNQMQGGMRAIESALADQRREKAYRDIKYRLAAARFETAMIRHAYVCRKAGFKEDQPRWPKGSGDDSGRWSGGAGKIGSAQQSGGDTSRVRLADAGSTSNSTVMSDANPEPIIPGAQYAAQNRTPINFDASAITTNPAINRTTARLVSILQRVKDTVEDTSDLSPQDYGTKIHTAFAAEVKAQGQLLGIASSDVETTFGGAYYGAKGSVRTDVVLRNDVGQVIAIYDVKTGAKGIEPGRAAQLRLKVGVGNEVPIIQMSFPYGLSRKQALFGKAFSVQTALNYGG